MLLSLFFKHVIHVFLSFVCVFWELLLNYPGKARVICLFVGHGGGRVCRSDRRRLHTDCSRKQHEHQRLRHGPAARQSLQRPLLSEVRILVYILYCLSRYINAEALTVMKPADNSWCCNHTTCKLFEIIQRKTTVYHTLFSDVTVFPDPSNYFEEYSVTIIDRTVDQSYENKTQAVINRWFFVILTDV